MSSKFVPLALLGVVGFSLTSCKDSPELVLKREEQRTEIKRLEGELSILNEKVKNMPPDRSKELAAAKVTAEAQATELARLEKEIATLDARKRELDKNFSDYRSKYLVKSN